MQKKKERKEKKKKEKQKPNGKKQFVSSRSVMKKNANLSAAKEKSIICSSF